MDGEERTPGCETTPVSCPGRAWGVNVTAFQRARQIPVAELRAGLAAPLWLAPEVQAVFKLIPDHTLDDIILGLCLLGPDLLGASDGDFIDIEAPVEHPLELSVEAWISLLRIPFLRSVIAARYPVSCPSSEPPV